MGETTDGVEISGPGGPRGGANRNPFHVVPFLLVIVFTTVSFKAPSDGTLSAVQSLSDPVRQCTLGAAYLLALALILLKPHRFIAVLGRNKIYLLSVVYVLASALWSKYPGTVFVAFVHHVGFTSAVLCAIHFFDDDFCGFLSMLLAVSLPMVWGSIALALFFPGRGVCSNGRWAGVGDHPNELGFICLISVWSAASGICFLKSRIMKSAALLTLGASAVCLYFCASVTSMICSLFVIASFMLLIDRRLEKPEHLMMKLAAPAWGAAFALFLAWVLQPALMGRGYLFNLMGRQSDLSGRTELWATGLGALARKPFLGWSFDSMASVLSKQIISYAQFHDGYLNLAVSGGLLGVILFALVLFKHARSSIRLLDHEYGASASLAVLVGAIIIHNISEASIMRVTHPLWLLFLLCYFYIDRLDHGREKTADLDGPLG